MNLYSFNWFFHATIFLVRERVLIDLVLHDFDKLATGVRRHVLD